jgi:hypothetical protein
MAGAGLMAWLFGVCVYLGFLAAVLGGGAWIVCKVLQSFGVI